MGDASGQHTQAFQVLRLSSLALQGNALAGLQGQVREVGNRGREHLVFQGPIGVDGVAFDDDHARKIPRADDASIKRGTGGPLAMSATSTGEALWTTKRDHGPTFKEALGETVVEGRRIGHRFVAP